MHNWVKTDLLRKVSTWDEAVKVLSKKFGSSALVFQSKTEVLEMTMQDGETANQYHLKFTNAMAEAGYDKNNVVLADLFFKGFPLDWQRSINRFLAASPVPLDSPVRTVARFAEEAISVYNAEKASISHGVKRFNESKDNDSKKFKSHKKNYGSKNHQNDKNGKKNVPYAATNNRTCDYCKKIRCRNHRCEEYLQAKNNKCCSNNRRR